MRTLRIGDRTLVLAEGTQLEQWSYERALVWLHDVAQDWPGREQLLRLSDATLGPADDIDEATQHLARLVASGELVIVREDRADTGASVRSDDGRWDAPRLGDLRRDRPTPGDDDRPRPRTPTIPPRDPSPRDPSPRTSGDKPTDTWTTFVAYAVFDQYGNPLHGTSRCTIDGKPHDRPLADDAIEIEPIAAHARVALALADLTTETEAPQ